MCGTDGKTYGNRCLLEAKARCVDGLEVKFKGVCEDGDAGGVDYNGDGVINHWETEGDDSEEEGGGLDYVMAVEDQYNDKSLIFSIRKECNGGGTE